MVKASLSKQIEPIHGSRYGLPRDNIEARNAGLKRAKAARGENEVQIRIVLASLMVGLAGTALVSKSSTKMGCLALFSADFIG